MDAIQLLKVANDLGVKSLPIIGRVLGAAVDLGLAVGTVSSDPALIHSQVLAIGALCRGHKRTLNYLMRALEGDDVREEFRKPLEELRDAIESPDDPPLRIRKVLDRVAAEFTSMADFRRWCESEYAQLGRQIDDLTQRVSRIEGCPPGAPAVVLGPGAIKAIGPNAINLGPGAIKIVQNVPSPQRTNDDSKPPEA